MTRLTIIGVGNLMEVIWPVIGPRTSEVIGVTADAADIERKRQLFGFEVVLDDNLGALRRNQPEVIFFAPPPTLAGELLTSVLQPYYEECRVNQVPVPDLYAFPPVPPGAVYLEALGDDVLVANIIPNNVTKVGGTEVVDEGHYVCTFPTPWPGDRLERLQRLFDGQGAFVQLEPDQLIPMLGGAATISSLWKAVPHLADLLSRTESPTQHTEVGEYLRARVRERTGFTPPVSTPVRAVIQPPRPEFLTAVAIGWHRGISTYFDDTDLADDAKTTLVSRGFDLTLHTTQVEPRSVLDDLAVGAATKGGVLERAIRSLDEDLLPLLEQGLNGRPDDRWTDELTDQVRQTAHTVRRHGLTLAGDLGDEV